jgi:hypothetical protein
MSAPSVMNCVVHDVSSATSREMQHCHVYYKGVLQWEQKYGNVELIAVNL